MQRRVEHRVAALALGLGAVHRDVGVADDLVRRGAGSASAMPIEAATTSSRPSSWNGVAAASQHALGDHGRLAGVADVVEQDGELVAAEPGDGVAGAQRRTPAGARPRRSSRSPTWWPSESLTSLKRSRSRNSTAAHARPALAALGAQDRLREAVQEQHAVGQPGQRVVQRVVLEALLGLAAVGDVGLGADDARRRARSWSRTAIPRASIQR